MFPPVISKDWRQLLVLLLVLGGGQQLAAAGLIKAKAWLAPILIERAWETSLNRSGSPVKPWPWADTWPVARLRAPAQGVERLVLAGDSGNALAFGPGHTNASAQLGTAGLAVIGGHRDTHFAFLRHLPAGRAVATAVTRWQLARLPRGNHGKWWMPAHSHCLPRSGRSSCCWSPVTPSMRCRQTARCAMWLGPGLSVEQARRVYSM